MAPALLNMDFLFIHSHFLIRMEARPGPQKSAGRQFSSRHGLSSLKSTAYSVSLLCWAAYWRGEIPFTSLNAREK